MRGCPKCGHRIPARALWTSTGLSGVVCSRCNTALEVAPGSHIILMMIAFTAGGIVAWSLEAARFAFLWQALAQFSVAVAVYSFLAGQILRYREKTPPTLHLQ